MCSIDFQPLDYLESGEPSSPSGDDSATLDQFLQSYPDVRFLRCQWQDYSGVLRCRITPIEHAKSMASSNIRLHVPALAFHHVLNNDTIPESDPRGSHVLIPDWASLYSRRSFDPIYATVMCCIVEYFPRKSYPDEDYCPRLALKSVISKARDRFGINFLVGFEIELQVMKVNSNGNLELHSNGLGQYAASGLRDPCFAYLQEVISILLEAGVGVGAFQAEGPRGQYELVLGPESPLRAVDQLVFSHDTIKCVFARHGLIATMAPRPIATSMQTAGQHTHISISPLGNERAFLAGMLQRLPQLCAFCLPYEISYERVQPYLAGHVVAWGTDNRAVPVRCIKTGHWELRCVDATANMYLTLAAFLSAGLLGCLKDEPLLWPDTGFITEHFPQDAVPLPRTIQAALTNLQNSQEELSELLESRVINHYLTLKKSELAILENVGSDQTRRLLSEVF